MKKILLSCIAIVAIAITTSAQQVLDISGGPVSHTYNVAASGGSTITNYNWAVTGGASGFVNSTTTTQSVTWNGAVGTYTLSITPESNNGCDGTPVDMTVQLVNGLPVTVAWDDATIEVCPNEATSNPTGGNVSATINLTGAVPTGNWSVNYSVDGVAAGSPASVSGTAATFTLSPNWANASTTTNATHHIVITGYTVNGTSYGPVAVDLTVDVYPTPTVGGISY